MELLLYFINDEAKKNTDNWPREFIVIQFFSTQCLLCFWRIIRPRVIYNGHIYTLNVQELFIKGMYIYITISPRVIYKGYVYTLNAQELFITDMYKH